MEVKKLISAACSAAMMTALIPAQLSAGAEAPKQATYISDILLAGYNSINNAGAAMDAKNRLISNGYKVVDTDLNGGCGAYSDRIYLGYKTTTDPKEAIKDVIIVDKFITDISEKVTENGVEYSLCPFDGDLSFGDVSGSLNSGAGGIDAHLFYTKEGDSAYAMSDIVFDDNSADAVSGTDLNDGAVCRDSKGNKLDTPVDKIYMHAVKSGSTVHNEANDSYYRVINTGMSWEKAKNYCEDLGGHLVTITDEAEQKYVLDLVKPAKKEICWIGGYRSQIEGETWITGEEFTYDNWDSILASSYSVDNVPFALRTESGFWSLIDPKKQVSLDADSCFVCEWDNLEGYNKKTDFSGHTYQAFDKNLSWKEAEEYCESIGGHLAVITSDEENQFIASLINNGKTYHYWLGGSIDSKNNFSWVTHEKPQYTNWSQFVTEEETVNTDHIAMQQHYEKWDKHSDETYNKYKKNYGFVCEWEKTAKAEFNGSRYAIINDDTTWKHAVSYCEDLGGHLVTITSAEEQEFVYELFKKNADCDICWIGGFRDNITGFEWINGEPFEYSNWSDILAGSYSVDQVPLAINDENGEWELIDPKWQYGRSCFICEWDKGVGDKLSWSNHDIQYFDIGMSWELAEKYCENLGGHLATIDNELDEKDIKKLLSSATKDVYWLGGKLNDDDEVEWLSDDYLADDWEHWAPGNPDKAEFGEYVLLHRTRSANRPPYSWSSADNTCASYGKENLGFICEWDKEMVYFYAPMTEPAQYLTTTTTSSATTTASTSTTTTTAVSSSSSTSTSKSTTASTTASKATTTTATTTTSVVYTPLYGDVNADGKVDTRDLTALNNFLNDRALYMLSPHGILNADAYNTGDGIDENDATAINYYINGIISELPYSGAFPTITTSSTSTTTTTTTTTTAKPTTTTTTTTTAQPTTTTTDTTTAQPTTTTTTAQPTTTTTTTIAQSTTTTTTTTAQPTTTTTAQPTTTASEATTTASSAVTTTSASTNTTQSTSSSTNAPTGTTSSSTTTTVTTTSDPEKTTTSTTTTTAATTTATTETTQPTTTTTSATTTTTTQPTMTTTSATTTTTTQPTTTTTSATTTTTTQPTTTTTSATTTTTTQPTTTTTSATTTTTTQPTTTTTSATTTTTTQPTTTTTSATTTTTTQPTTTTTSATTTTTTQPTTTTTSATTTTTTQPTTTTTSATTTTTTQPTTTTTSATTTTTTQPTTTTTSATTTTTTQPTTTTTSATTTTTTQPTTTTTSATTTTTTQPTTTTTSATTTTATTTDTPATTTTPNGNLGDVNADGKVDAKDASKILVAYAAASTEGGSGLSDTEKSVADVNGDGKVDAKDASTVLAYYALISTATGEVPTLKEFAKPKES